MGYCAGAWRDLSLPTYRTMNLACWGNYPVQPCRVARPERVRDLAPLIEQARKAREALSAIGAGEPGSPATLVARGLGRSYGDASLNEGQGVVVSERLNRFLAFDPESAVLECEAGVTIGDIITHMLPRGFFPPVSPGTKFITIGGGIAVDVHGKSHHSDGSIAQFTESFQLLTAEGRLLSCSRTEHPEIFWATLGGMGLTGIIISARIRLRPVESSYFTVDTKRARDLDSAMELFAGELGARRFTVAWIDCLASGKKLGRSVLMCGDHAALSDLPADLRADPARTRPVEGRSFPCNAPGWLLSPPTLRAMNIAYYAMHGEGRSVQTYDQFFYPLDGVLHWNRAYGKRGLQQYQVVLPPESSRAALLKLLERLSATGRASFLAVLKTMGPESGGLLSFPHQGWTLALDIPNSPGLDAFLRELDRITLDHGGRRYLAKDACLAAPDFKQMYPRAEEFCALRAKLDPEGVFASSLGRRLGLCEADTSPGPGAGPGAGAVAGGRP